MGKWTRFSSEELAWIEAHATLPSPERHKQFFARFGRDDVSRFNLIDLCKRRGWKTGRDGRWKKGEAPSNRGKKLGTKGRSAETQFKTGQASPNARPLGHERIGKGGYIYMNVAMLNPHTGYGRRYVLKHRYLWIKANGPVPDGHSLKSIDGNRLNTDPSNWIAIPLGMQPRLNGSSGRGYDGAPADLKPVIMATARLEYAIKERRVIDGK